MNRVTDMTGADRCAALRRERETHPFTPHWCECDHPHPPGTGWCDLCEEPVRTAGDVVAYRIGGNDYDPADVTVIHRDTP